MEVDERLLELLAGSAEEARYVVMGGKRIRPRLTMAVSTGLGLGKEALDLASAVELIHAASLAHDDVIDSATVRRNRPTANALWGPKTAVLAGDFLFVRALRLIASLVPGGVEYVGSALEDMIAAELLQLRRGRDVTLEEYLRIVDGKTGRLFGVALGLPALYAEKPFWNELDRAGVLVGRAFQIVDDVLDFFPGTGKERFKDVMEGKRTLPLILHPSEASGEELFRELLEANAFERALDVAKESLEGALEILGALPFESDAVRAVLDDYFGRAFRTLSDFMEKGT